MITGLYRLKLEPDLVEKINAGASLHKRYSNLTFKIIDVGDDSITVRATQGKSFHENQMDTKKIVEVTKKLFANFVDMKIHVHPVMYQDSPVDIVDIDWIKKKMHKHKISLKQLTIDFGIEKSTLSAIINDHRELSRFAKVGFYYYFKR